jgi:8-oxo-dGTP pyrophosphatase MutT (NUDIX family)
VPDELVGLWSLEGREIGAVTRSRMRTENLHHAATGVVVLNSADQIYIHRRTTSKDVYPGRYDFAAGGVIAFGEAPLAAAERELAEELGVTGSSLTSIGATNYSDQQTSFCAFLYWTQWDGEITWQPEEVSWGGWHSIPDVISWISRAPHDWMPDTVALLSGWLSARVVSETPINHRKGGE